MCKQMMMRRRSGRRRRQTTLLVTLPARGNPGKINNQPLKKSYVCCLAQASGYRLTGIWNHFLPPLFPEASQKL